MNKSIINNTNEIWKDVVGFEGLYQVSNLGRIKSLSKNVGFYFRKEKILSNCYQNNGYLVVNLSKKTEVSRKSIHRLVAQAFIPNPERKAQVNHKDGNKQNNCVSNLEWCTDSENKRHAFKTGLNKHTPPIRIGKENGSSKSVIQYDCSMSFVKKWDCIMEASKNNRIDNSSITKCCKGKLKTAGGFIWRYMNDYYK